MLGLSYFAIILRFILLSLRSFSGPRLYFPMSTSLFLGAIVQCSIICLISRIAVRCYGHMSIPAEKEDELTRKFDDGTCNQPGEFFQTLESAAYTLKHVHPWRQLNDFRLLLSYLSIFYQQRGYLYQKPCKAQRETVPAILEVYAVEIVHMQKQTSSSTELAPGQHVQIMDLQIQR